METINSNRENEGKDNQNVTADGKRPLRGKSCKGCLFYSSVLNSKSQSPFCVGLSRTLQQASLSPGKECSIVDWTRAACHLLDICKVKHNNARNIQVDLADILAMYSIAILPNYVVSSDSEVLEGNQTLGDFKYACVGYSVHLEKNIHSTEPEKQLVELPFCVGVKILSSERASNPDSVPAHFHKGKVQEDGHISPQPQPQPRQPIQIPSNGFLNRFARNAGVVATGVKRNILKVSDRIKKKMDNALDPYRRRSK